MNNNLGKDMRGYFGEYFGQKEQERQKFCLTSTRGVLGLPLSRLFVDEKFDKNIMNDVSKG